MKQSNNMSNKYTIDATGKVVGRLATEISVILMGKNSPDFMPNIDNKNKVVISNVNKMLFSGKKLSQKVYHHHSGYPGGIKKTHTKDIMVKKPEQVLYVAVRNMLPKNKLRIDRLKRLSFK